MTVPAGHGFAKGDKLNVTQSTDPAFSTASGRIVAVSQTSVVYDPGGKSTMATVGIVLGALALTLGVVGVVVINSAVNDLDQQIDQIDQDLGTTEP